jgi:protein O-GlcNAc transferase
LKRKNKNVARRRNVSKKGSRSAAFGINGKLREAGLLHKSGRLAEAEDVYKEILRIAPDHTDILNLLGLAVFQKGEYSAAEGFIRKAIRINPSNPLYYINLGNALHGLNKENDAANAYLQALAIHPDHAEALNNLGNVYYVQGKMDKSLSCYKRVIELNGENPDACNNIGIVLRKLGRLDEAVSILRKALELNPDHARALNNLGIALKEQNKLVEAIAYYRKSLEIQPESDTYNNLALALKADGRPDEAVSVCRKALEIYPENFGICFVLGGLLKSHGQPEAAVACYQKALSIDPDHVETYNNMGDILSSHGQTDKAILCFKKALRIKPDDFKIYLNLGTAFKNQGKMSMAVAAYKRVLEIEPQCAPACNNLAGALLKQGKVAEAIKSYREAIAIQPDFAVAHSNLLFTHNYQNHKEPEWLFSQHRNWARTHALSKGDDPAFIPGIDSTSRKIRIGYCSPDFRTHSVAYFLEAIIKTHDRSEFEIFCYSDVTRPDEVTRTFASSVDCFTNIQGMDNIAVAEQIRRDKIDILVDLAGHTAGYRIPLFSIKPAPIQVSYLGYPNTTGLTSMDYRLTDARADPPGLTDHLYSEKLVRLPHTFLCYTPPERSPEIETAANRDSGQIIFGSFNNRAKITPEVVKAWAKILTQVPDGRIILKSRVFADPETRNLLIDLFMENGVERGRIELVSHIPSMLGHLQFYNRIDIGLDTFPYNGTTTTCEALWMGVPIITLAGRTHRSRVGASLLSNVGLEEFIAESVEDYVEKGVSLANDVKKRKLIHRDLRPRMARSFLMDSAQFTRSLEKIYHWMFNEWLGSSGILPK